MSESGHRPIDQRNDGLAPGHPGRGKPTSLIRAESPDGEPEVGGFYVFFPSGATKQIAWRQPQPIMPTLDAAKEFTAKLIEQLQRDGSAEAISDFDKTNWASVVAAVQRVILDWNDQVQRRISTRMAQLLGPDGRRLH
jgi:hypothetical protein